MKVKTIVVISAVVVLAGVIGVEEYRLYRLQNNLDNAAQLLSEADLELGRAQTAMASANKVHAKALAELDKKYQNEIKKNQELVVMYAKLKAAYNAMMEDGDINVDPQPGDIVTDFAADPEGTLYIKEEGKLAELEGLPFEYSDFRLDIEGDYITKSLNYKLHQRFSAQFVETRTKDNKYKNYAMISELDDKGKKVGDMKLESFEVVKTDELQKSFKWWNPKLDVALTGGITNKLDPAWSLSGGVSFMSFGKTEDDLDWRFGRVGIGVTHTELSLSVSPVQYNISKKLPLLSNTWIQPLVTYAPIQNSFSFELGISLVL